MTAKSTTALASDNSVNVIGRARTSDIIVGCRRGPARLADVLPQAQAVQELTPERRLMIKSRTLEMLTYAAQ
jgi:hypothetical protein